MHHLHRQFVGFRQGEKLSRQPLQLCIQGTINAVATQIEKADITRRNTQTVKKRLPLPGVAIKLRKIQQRQRLQRQWWCHYPVPLHPRQKPDRYKGELSASLTPG
ncbi:hypothetical protein D3C85_1434760 [compost metagenome]